LKSSSGNRCVEHDASNERKTLVGDPTTFLEVPSLQTKDGQVAEMILITKNHRKKPSHFALETVVGGKVSFSE